MSAQQDLQNLKRNCQGTRTHKPPQLNARVVTVRKLERNTHTRLIIRDTSVALKGRCGTIFASYKRVRRLPIFNGRNHHITQVAKLAKSQTRLRTIAATGRNRILGSGGSQNAGKLASVHGELEHPRIPIQVIRARRTRRLREAHHRVLWSYQVNY